MHNYTLKVIKTQLTCDYFGKSERIIKMGSRLPKLSQKD